MVWLLATLATVKTITAATSKNSHIGLHIARSHWLHSWSTLLWRTFRHYCPHWEVLRAHCSGTLPAHIGQKWHDKNRHSASTTCHENASNCTQENHSGPTIFNKWHRCILYELRALLNENAVTKDEVSYKVLAEDQSHLIKGLKFGGCLLPLKQILHFNVQSSINRTTVKPDDVILPHLVVLLWNNSLLA